MSDRVLDELISRMVDSGKSDDDIRFIVDHYMTDPSVRETIRQSNMKAQAGVNTDPDVAIKNSWEQTALDTAKSFGNRYLSMVKPSSNVGTAEAIRDALLPPVYGGAARDYQRVKDAVPALIDQAKSVASGDPKAGGAAIADLSAALIAPRIAPHVPNSMATTGAAIDKLGDLATKVAPNIGMGEVLRDGLSPGIAVAAAPYGIKMLGKAIQKGGELMGGKDYFAPETPAPPVSKNAGGILLKNPPMRVPVEDRLAGALDEVRQPRVDPSVSMPNAKTMTAAGRPASTAEEFAVSNPAVATAGRVTAADVAAGPVEQQAASTQAPTGADILAQAESAPNASPTPTRQDKMWIRDAVPPSKSSGTAGAGSLDSATPGLTRNDMEAVGLNPDVKVTKLTKAMADKILSSRAARHSSYAEQASLANRLNMLIEKD